MCRQRPTTLPRYMGLCSSAEQTNNSMGSTFTSMEDDTNKHTVSANKSGATSRAGRYGGSSATTTTSTSNNNNNINNNNNNKSVHTEPINDVIVGALSTELFTCSDDTTVCLLDTTKSGAEHVVQQWKEHKRPVSRMTYGANTDALWSCSRDLTMKMWRRDQSASVQTIEDGHSLNITALALNPSESILCSGSRDTTVCLWDVTKGALVRRKKTSRNLVTCLKWLSESTVVQGSEDLKLRVWDCRDHVIQAAATMTGYVYFPLCMDVIEEHYVCTGSKGFDGVGCEVRLWDMRKNQCVKEMSGHRQSVVGCQFYGSKDAIVTVSKDQMLKIWSPESHTSIADVLGQTSSQFTCVAAARVGMGGSGGGHGSGASSGWLYCGAASGYSKYKYDGGVKVEHVKTHILL